MAHAARALQGSFPHSRLHQADPDRLDPAQRRLLADLGWFGLALSPESGGAGLTAVEAMLVFRELGRGLGPIACLPISLAAVIAARAGHVSLTNALTGGAHSVAFAVALEKAERKGEAFSAQARILNARDATILLYINGNESLLLDLHGVDLTPLPCLDKSVSMASVILREAPVLASVTDATPRRMGELLTGAILLGIAEAARDMTVDFAKVRHTFGKPIGAYQAVRHPCADMAVRCEVARCQLFLASVCVRDDREDTDLQVGSGKLLANAAALSNVDWNVQIHGGIAVMDEHDAHLYLKHAHLLSRCFGADKALLDRIVAAPLRAA
jgi:alkylation response protein AidB-like acyl-CoA dehydrogenase